MTAASKDSRLTPSLVLGAFLGAHLGGTACKIIFKYSLIILDSEHTIQKAGMDGLRCVGLDDVQDFPGYDIIMVHLLYPEIFSILIFSLCWV